MKILLSNDDGVYAPGLKALCAVLQSAYDVIVVAPDRDRSGASHSLTLRSPLAVHELSENRMCVEGTPVDCVHLALTGLLKELPDMVISGINAGANLGDDVLYSGTVAAAIEGRFLALPALAISLVSDACVHFDTAARVALDLLQRFQDAPLPADTLLNVNVPDLPYDELSGFVSTRLGRRHCAEPMIEQKDPRGHCVYWVGASGQVDDGGAGTDFEAIASGYVSVTPLQIDMTAHDSRPLISDWLEQTVSV